ncbi:5-hydroxytryptamine receptor 1-like isoform X2 [Hyposmocoma kahamanoa]|uniref:5-hydroxytryptamine receptor 1-like isoform X2 n=1 Tax=Hyposmocoma kahamanoa TaxID=1477025 RepID=UPI000E6D9E64|nr:5-hydroxytryptamine receptor 1-like isoform X2 [Hyposmocoma kahamanoa]
MLVVTATTIAGNAVVLVAVWRARRAPAHYPLASLAAADLLVGLSVLPVAAARELIVFNLPWALCACWSTLDVLCCTASILSICALGWERWYGITAPLARARRNRRAKVSALLVWPVSTVIALPAAFIPSPRHYFLGEAPKACTVNTNVGYVFASVSFSFYIPATIMMYLYAYILRSLAVPIPIRAHRGPTSSKQVANNNAQNQKEMAMATPIPKQKTSTVQKLTTFMTPKRNHLAVPNAPGQEHIPSPLKTSNSPGGIIPRQRRATRTIVMLMSLFLICWTPFFVMLPIPSASACVT